MKYVRIYTGPDNISHFEDVDVTLKQGPNSQTSDPLNAESIIFGRIPADYTSSWHRAPCRQFVIPLTGAMEIEASDGEVRRIGAGEILLAEDTSGKGHITRAVGGEERLSVYVPLPESM